jgi:hypothetical protein
MHRWDILCGNGHPSYTRVSFDVFQFEPPRSTDLYACINLRTERVTDYNPHAPKALGKMLLKLDDFILKLYQQTQQTERRIQIRNEFYCMQITTGVMRRSDIFDTTDGSFRLTGKHLKPDYDNIKSLFHHAAKKFSFFKINLNIDIHGLLLRFLDLYEKVHEIYASVFSRLGKSQIFAVAEIKSVLEDFDKVLIFASHMALVVKSYPRYLVYAFDLPNELFLYGEVGSMSMTTREHLNKYVRNVESFTGWFSPSKIRNITYNDFKTTEKVSNTGDLNGVSLL